ncbi:MAG: Franean1_4349 family RiPP [Deltaproteobacteria bacterium]|nr:Franean1_4349 family RiPP [Deltaproteobacteria bacterium]MBI3386156.1 Franean1_4349 family RiPP [Deltaproteobacteria bacterium]
MSQRSVESIIGRLITDGAFRGRFFVEPAAVCRDHGLDVTAAEVTALLRIEGRALDSVAHGLDPKIVRALAMSPCVLHTQVENPSAFGVIVNTTAARLGARSAKSRRDS